MQSFGKCPQCLTLCTDADVVKMDVINALDSSTSQPKGKKVRKPAASKETKPPGEEKKMVEEKSTTNILAKSSSPKKSTTTLPAPVTPPADPHQEESSNSVKEQPAAEENSNGVPLSEEWAEGTTEPKKKKKKKKEANKEKDTDKEMKKGSETVGQVACEKPFEETKKANGEEKQSENTEHQTMIVQHDEVPDSVVTEEKREKRAKKKKKEKSEQGEGHVSSEQVSELASEGTGQILPAKKRKRKRSKSDVENSEATHKQSKIIPVETPDENSSVVDKKSETNQSDFQDLSEQIFKKKKRKKEKADRDEATPELADKDKSKIVDINGNNLNESTLKNDPVPLPPLDPVTPQTEKKKSEYMK